jgi:hypothetical protein
LQGKETTIGEKGVNPETTTTNVTPAVGGSTTPTAAQSVSNVFGQVAATVQVS